MITSAQRSSVAALNLPFDLSDTDIARQFNSDGSAIKRELGDGMQRVRGLSRAAMRQAAQAALPMAA